MPSTILKTNEKESKVVFFLYVKVYLLWKSIQYTKNWDRKQISKKFPSDKIDVRKTALFYFC